MSWSYDTSLPADLDKVRLLIGDTDTTDQQLSDEELGAMLTVYGAVNSAAIAACRALAAKYARYADKWVGDLKILASQKHRAYLELAEELQAAGASATGAALAVPTAGGIYTAEKEAYEGNTARVSPFFHRGMHDDTTIDLGDE